MAYRERSNHQPETPRGGNDTLCAVVRRRQRGPAPAAGLVARADTATPSTRESTVGQVVNRRLVGGDGALRPSLRKPPSSEVPPRLPTRPTCLTGWSVVALLEGQGLGGIDEEGDRRGSEVCAKPALWLNSTRLHLWAASASDSRGAATGLRVQVPSRRRLRRSFPA